MYYTNKSIHMKIEIKKIPKVRTTLNKRKLFFDLTVFFVSLFVVIASILLVWVSSLKMPDFSTIASREMESTTKIYDRTGKVLLYAFRQKIRRTEVPLTEISANIIKATIAIEDTGFYDHRGISLRGILRSFYVNLMTSKTQGGSTLTQQVVKNALLTQDRTIERKVKEIILSIKLEQTVSKDQILSMYLNDAPYSGEIYGVEEASLFYFATSSKNLNLTQAAYLAAIPKNPPLYSPYGKNFQKLEDRKNTVLNRMLITKTINQKEYDEAVATKVTFIKKEDNASKAHHFVFFIRDYLQKTYGEDFEIKGYSVITTLDYEMQKEIEDIAKVYIPDYIKKNSRKGGPDISKLNVGVVALDAPTGQILAMLGSRDYNDPDIDGKYNIATALRQPGSSIKPLVYAAAFEKGLTPEVVAFDSPTEFNPACPRADGQRREAPCYSPQNYDEGFYGGITLREALGNSRNITAVKVLHLVGVQNAIDFARKMGITSLKSADKYGLSLALGGGEVSLLELTNAYGAFSQQGELHKNTAILSVKDKTGKLLEEYKDTGYQVISQETAAKISSVLSDNSARSRVFGPSSKLYFGGRDVAAKTGTTNNVKDGWVIGYTTDTVLGAWIGKNDNTTFGDVSASLSIVPMWNQIFNKIMSKKAPGNLDKGYEPNPEIEGVKCDANFGAMDIIRTVINYGIFPNINPNDAQINNWFYESNSPLCGGSGTDPNLTPTDGSSTTMPITFPINTNQNPQIQVNPISNPIPTVGQPTTNNINTPVIQ
jgi:penicillin-binding protein 1C